MKLIDIPRSVIIQLFAQAQQTANSCGLIYRAPDKHLLVQPCFNSLSIKSFSKDFEQFITHNVDLTKGQLIAFYQVTDDYLSQIQQIKQLQVYADLLFLFIILNTKGVLELKAYNFENKKIVELELNVL